MKYNRCCEVSNESPYNSALIDTHNGEFDEKKIVRHTFLVRGTDKLILEYATKDY